ncbi:hypothetical protein PSEUDO9AZ_70009 [Pseudomonas sp. 9AZ]|nr:hypothetical protein [Pseudomonas sp. 9AZ]VXD05229.1 hypothetical protein PSEUDO9AZ_70009 [Pseudomonas sp. 9AZ]
MPVTPVTHMVQLLIHMSQHLLHMLNMHNRVIEVPFSQAQITT